jgi:hypothetical protein
VLYPSFKLNPFMQSRVTRSTTKTLLSVPTTADASPQQSHLPSVEDIEHLFDDPLPSNNASPANTFAFMEMHKENAQMNDELPSDNPAPIPLSQLDPRLQSALAVLLEFVQIPPRNNNNNNNNNNNATPAPRATTAQPPSRSRGSCVKVRDPEPFDGSDASKLEPFLTQCGLVFRSHPDDYQDDSIKITYAVSWLTSTAQRWYTPTLRLHENDLPYYAVDWEAFEEELRSNFGEPDPVASAALKLDKLVMKDSHHLHCYNVDFNEYAAITGFNEQALYAAYYKGLAPRIKRAFVYSRHPKTLTRLRVRAKEIDISYWELQNEERYRPASTSSHTHTPRSSATPSSTPAPSANRSQPSTPKPAPKPASKATMPSPSASQDKKDEIAKNLGPNGKLLPEEKEHRRKNNLCLICGSSKHFLDNCPSKKPQAKAAQLVTVEEDAAEGASSEVESSDSSLN